MWVQKLKRGVATHRRSMSWLLKKLGEVRYGVCGIKQDVYTLGERGRVVLWEVVGVLCRPVWPTFQWVVPKTTRYRHQSLC